MEYYLAFDLGAGSGRAILGTLGDAKNLQIYEVHRFANSIVNVGGNLQWDILGIYQEMIKAIRIYAKNYTQPPMCIGIDAWGCDFSLLDDRGILIGLPFSGRDRRTISMMEEFFLRIPKERLHRITGVRSRPNNTLFQLYSMVHNESPHLEIAADLLFIPDVLNYFLTGVKATEFTCATISELFNSTTRSWDDEIFEQLEVPKSLMQEVMLSGTPLGNLTESVSSQTGLPKISVVTVASHDSASAFSAVSVSEEDTAYISCGTMSLMGIEMKGPVINEKTLQYNFANYGGVCGTLLLLKSITGLWLLQECQKEWVKRRQYSYNELVKIAAKAPSSGAVIDPDHPDFFKPASMPAAIAQFCRRTEQPVPQGIGQIVRLILESLALAYRHTLEQLEDIRSKGIEQIHIVGGGSQNKLLCQFTADATGLPVYAGPAEATAIGNILIQAMAYGKISSLNELRQIVRQSCSLSLYQPRSTLYWDKMYERFLEVKQPNL